jgi:hypothetical protein
VDIELGRLVTVFRDREGRIDARAVNATLAVVDGLKPQNEAEAMLALQMAVTHGLTMKFSSHLYSGRAIETLAQQDSAALTLSAFGAASDLRPKFVSPSDPAAQWTGAMRGSAFFAYSDNYLIDVKFGIIMDVEASRLAGRLND